MNKIKIIDLLNMISRGEEVPQKVLYDENEYSFVRRNRLFAKYIREPFDARVPYYLFTDVWSVYDEVEILEEEKKMPENINLAYIDKEYLLEKEDVDRKINEIINRHNILVDKVIDYLDYLKSKGDE